MVLLAQSPPSCRSTRSLQVKKATVMLALLWQILAIDLRNWIPESDFQ
jgi:hypothetical protein